MSGISVKYKRKKEEVLTFEKGYNLLLKICFGSFDNHKGNLKEEHIVKQINLYKDPLTSDYLQHFTILIDAHLKQISDPILREREILGILENFGRIHITSKEWDYYQANKYQAIQDLPVVTQHMLIGLGIRDSVIESVKDSCRKYQIDYDKLISIMKEETPKKNSKPMPLIKWQCSQKELAELIIELERKGWIAEITQGQRMGICRSLLSAFDISATKKRADSDEVASFYKIMNPDRDPKTKEITYPKIFSTEYKPFFDQIKPPDAYTT